MATTLLRDLDDVRAAVGRPLGTTEWTEVTQRQIELFGKATVGDGGATVPPLLVLALTNLFMPQLVEVRGVSMGVNYGTGEVRFPAAAPIGSRLRASAELTACDDIDGGVQTTIRITVEADGADAPVCTVDALSRWLV